MPAAEEILVWMKLRGQAAVVRGLRGVEAASKRVAAGVRGMGAGMDHTRKKAGLFRQSLTIMRKSLVGLTAASSAFVAVGLVKGALDFEDSMARVKGTLLGNRGFGPEVFQRLQDAAMHWAEVSRFSSAEVADGVFKLVSNGFTAQQAIAALGGTTDLAGASMIDMATAANIQTSVLKQFGFGANKARHVADVLTTAVNAGSAELQDLALSFKYIGPIAATFGTSFQDVTAALEVMAQGGFRGAFSGRALRTGFVRLVKPTKDVNKGIKAMGLTIGDLQGPDGLLPLPKLLDKLRERYNKMPGAKGKEAIARIFGTEAVTQWLYLIRNSDKPLDKMRKAIGKNAGNARLFAETMLKTTRGAMEQFFNTVQDLATRLIVRFSPQIQGFFNSLSKGLTDLRKPNSELRKQIEPLIRVMSAAFTIFQMTADEVLPVLKTAVGAVLIGLGPFASVLELIAENGTVTIPVIKGLVAGFVLFKILMFGKAGLINGATGFGKSMKALNAIIRANPIIFWLTVGVALVVLFKALYERNETFRESVQKAGRIFMTVFNWLSDKIVSIYNWVKENWVLLVGILTGPIGLAVVYIIQHWNSIKQGATDAVNWVKTKFGTLVDFFRGLPGRLVGAGKAMGKAIINGMINMINSGLGRINSALSFTIPGPGPLPDVTVDAPDVGMIPLLAAGGTAKRGGRAIVGERGPEAVDLPVGARVTPLKGPASLPLSNLASVGGGGGSVTVPVYLDGREIAKVVHRRVEQRQARR